ncbi:Hypothetical protein CINCED_3A003600, partial [Cinara cedri]
LERQVLRENCKRKASDTISVRPIKIIRTELVKKKAMYDKQRQIYPAFPKSLTESIEQLKSVENNDVLKVKGDQFVFVPDNKLCMLFLTMRRNIISSYIINCLRNGFYIPVVYFFSSEKFKQTCIDMWLFLQKLSGKQKYLSGVLVT